MLKALEISSVLKNGMEADSEVRSAAKYHQNGSHAVLLEDTRYLRSFTTLLLPYSPRLNLIFDNLDQFN